MASSVCGDVATWSTFHESRESVETKTSMGRFFRNRARIKYGIVGEDMDHVNLFPTPSKKHGKHGQRILLSGLQQWYFYISVRHVKTRPFLGQKNMTIQPFFRNSSLHCRWIVGMIFPFPTEWKNESRWDDLSIQFPFLKKSWKSPWFQFAPTRSLKTSKKTVGLCSLGRPHSLLLRSLFESRLSKRKLLRGLEGISERNYLVHQEMWPSGYLTGKSIINGGF